MQKTHGGIADLGMVIRWAQSYVLSMNVATQHDPQAPPPGLRAFGSYVSQT